MREDRVGAFGEKLLDMVLRRIRLVTILVMIGAGGMILAHDASWTSVAFVVVALLVVLFGWLSVVFWIRLFRNNGGRREV